MQLIFIMRKCLASYKGEKFAFTHDEFYAQSSLFHKVILSEKGLLDYIQRVSKLGHKLEGATCLSALSFVNSVKTLQSLQISSSESP